MTGRIIRPAGVAVSNGSVVESVREPMLGCDDALGGAADVRAFRVVDERVDRAQHESTAVEMDKDRVGTGAGGSEHPDLDLAVGNRNPLIRRCGDRLDRDPSASQRQVELVAESLATLGRGQRATRVVEGFLAVDPRLDFRWRHHRSAPRVHELPGTCPSLEQLAGVECAQFPARRGDRTARRLVGAKPLVASKDESSTDLVEFDVRPQSPRRPVL